MIRQLDLLKPHSMYICMQFIPLPPPNSLLVTFMLQIGPKSWPSCCYCIMESIVSFSDFSNPNSLFTFGAGLYSLYPTSIAQTHWLSAVIPAIPIFFQHPYWLPMSPSTLLIEMPSMDKCIREGSLGCTMQYGINPSIL